MPALLLAAIVTIIPSDLIIKDTVDTIEIFHDYDTRGNHMYSYLIFWDYYPNGEFHVVDFRRYCHKNIFGTQGDFTVIWFEINTFRQVSARHLFTRSSIEDPATQDQLIFPADKRRGLTPRLPTYDQLKKRRQLIYRNR